MEKKRVKRTGGDRGQSPAKIPPSWQLTREQRDFINDLWQDDAREPGPEHLTNNLIAPGQHAKQHLQQCQAQQNHQRQSPALSQIV